MANDLSQRVMALEDRAAIENLIASYGPLADSNDADAVAALWTEDGIYHVAGFGEAQGHPAIADFIRSPTHQQLVEDGCAHMLSKPHITLDGQNARAVNYSAVYRHNAGQYCVYRVSANTWRLQKIRDQWRIKRRDNALLDGTQAARILLRQGIGD